MRYQIRFCTLFICFFLISGLALAQEELGLLISRNESRVTRAELIRKETKELRLSTFIFDIDKIGTETLGLMAEAAQRGVKVSLNIDVYESTLAKNSAILHALEELGIEIRLFNPIYRHPFALNNRNHMKSLIGSDFMILGDRNMTKDYFKLRSDNNYISFDVLVKGGEVKEARRHFDWVYNKAQLKKPIDTHNEMELASAREELKKWMAEAKNIPSPRRPLEVDNYKVQKGAIEYWGDSPSGFFGKNPNGVHKGVVKIINRAQSTLEFTNPYVLFTRETKKAIKKALKRGVKITVNSNSALSTDSRLMAMAWDFHKYELTKMGITVNELKPGQYIHAKTIVMDNKEVFIGSFNLDPRSQNLNLENGIIIKDPRIAERVTRHNHLIQRFTVPVPAVEVIPTMTALEKTGFCVKRGLQKFATTLVRPFL